MGYLLAVCEKACILFAPIDFIVTQSFAVVLSSEWSAGAPATVCGGAETPPLETGQVS